MLLTFFELNDVGVPVEEDEASVALGVPERWNHKVFLNGPFIASFSFIFVFFNTKNKCSIKICRCLDSNCRPLVTEATALPTEPQPLPKKHKSWFISKDIHRTTGAVNAKVNLP